MFLENSMWAFRIASSNFRMVRIFFGFHRGINRLTGDWANIGSTIVIAGFVSMRGLVYLRREEHKEKCATRLGALRLFSLSGVEKSRQKKTGLKTADCAFCSVFNSVVITSLDFQLFIVSTTCFIIENLIFNNIVILVTKSSLKKMHFY